MRVFQIPPIRDICPNHSLFRKSFSTALAPGPAAKEALTGHLHVPINDSLDAARPCTNQITGTAHFQMKVCQIRFQVLPK